MKLSDQEISLWIAEKLGWTDISVCLCEAQLLYGRPPNEPHRKRHVPQVNDPAMTVMLMEKMFEPELWLESDPSDAVKYWGCTANLCGDGAASSVATTIGRAVAEAFMLANGWTET